MPTSNKTYKKSTKNLWIYNRRLFGLIWNLNSQITSKIILETIESVWEKYRVFT